MEYELVVPKTMPSNLLEKNWVERKCYYRKGAVPFLNLVHEMCVHMDDVWLVTLPKCGTTWMQELLWLIMHNCDFKKAHEEHLEVRSPFMEFDYILKENLSTALKPVENLVKPRLIKSHLPLPLLPAQLWAKKPKVVYVYRNPKDSIVSEYYFGRSMGFNMEQSLEEYVLKRLNSDFGNSNFDHVTEFYALRNQSWIYYTSYELMKRDLKQVVEEVCSFLGKTVDPEKQLPSLLKHLSFEDMKANNKTNHLWEIEQVRAKVKLPFENHRFVRKGKIDGYKDDLSPKVIAKMDQWITEELSKRNVSLQQLLLLEE